MTSESDSLFDEISEGMEFVEGQSSPGYLSGRYEYPGDAPQTTAANTSVEFYEGEVDHIRSIGVIATREAADPNARGGGVDTSTQSGRINVEFGFFAQTTLVDSERFQQVGRVFGMRADVRNGNRGTEIAFIGPKDVSTLNGALETLGVTDRQYVRFEGARFSGATMLEHLAKRELLIADENESMVHDLSVHGLGYALIAPQLLDKIAERSQKIMERYNRVHAKVGNRSLHDCDHKDVVELFAAQEEISKLTSQFDFFAADLAVKLSRAEKSEVDQVTLQGDIGRITGIADIAEREELADATLRWSDELVDRAQELVDA